MYTSSTRGDLEWSSSEPKDLKSFELNTKQDKIKKLRFMKGVNWLQK